MDTLTVNNEYVVCHTPLNVVCLTVLPLLSNVEVNKDLRFAPQYVSGVLLSPDATPTVICNVTKDKNVRPSPFFVNNRPSRSTYQYCNSLYARNTG